MVLEEFMRSTACLVLLAALLAGACDRGAVPVGQGNETAAAPAAAGVPAAGSLDRSHKGEAAPVYAFNGPDGKLTSLAAFKGKPVLLNLWATWCGPCVKELPTLDALAAAQAGTLQVIPLSQDTDTAKVAPFFAQRHFRALKPYTDGKMAWLPAVTANLPTSILYDAAGREVWRTVGDLDWTGEVARRALAEAR
jgi:thiol-disulfide isomerase/thioredoxin